MSKRKQLIKRTCVLLLILIIYALFLSALDLHCPISAIIGIECPTCGITRALISLLRLDFKASFDYHPLAIPVTVSVWLLLNAEFFKHKRLVTSISLSVIFLNFIHYLLRIIN